MLSDDESGYDYVADINMVPLVDVVFVLLIIFMTTAPLMQRGIDVDLPASKTNTMKSEERIMIVLDKAGEISVNDEQVTPSQLPAVLETLKLKDPEATVYLKSDRSVQYGRVVMVMDVIKQVGIDKLGMVTEAPVSDATR